MRHAYSCAFFCLFVTHFALATTPTDPPAPLPAFDLCGTELSGANPARIMANAVMKAPSYVHVDPDRITQVAGILAKADFNVFNPPTWDYPPYPARTMTPAEAIRFFLVIDAINYRYVTDDGLAEFSHDGWKGAGLMTKRVLEHWDRLKNPVVLARLTDADVEAIFAADVPLPDISARRKHLNEVGMYFARNPDAGHDSWLGKYKTPMGLAIHLAREIPGFQDLFLKRAQLFVGMIIGRYRNEANWPTAFRDAGELSIYADYVLPSILHRMGILRYHPDLEKRIRRGETLEPNSQPEVEIRAATIVASDLLKAALVATGRYPDISILGLDFALWIQAKEIDIPNTEMPSAVFVAQPLRYHRTNGGTAY